jgi:hypothetical protein
LRRARAGAPCELVAWTGCHVAGATAVGSEAGRT